MRYRALAACLLTGLLHHSNLHAEQPPLKFNLLYSSGSMGEQYSRRYLQELCRRINRACELMVLPGKRAMVMMESGQLDGEIGRLDRFLEISNSKTYLKISPPYIERRLLIATRAASPYTITSLNDLSLRPASVGYQRGYAYFQSLAERYRNVTPVALGSVEQCFSMLALERLDACIYDDLELNTTSYRLLRDGVLRTTPSLESTPANLYLHQRQQPILSAVEQATQEMRANGTDKRLQHQFLLAVSNEVLKLQILEYHSREIKG